MVSDTVRVPTEWIDKAHDALEALNEGGVILSEASVVFRDGERHGAPAGVAIHFERDPPYREDDDGT